MTRWRERKSLTRCAGFCLVLAFLPALLLAVEPPVPELHRLSLDRAVYLPAPLQVTAEDLVLSLREGAGFAARAEDGPTGLVLVGKGTMRFEPPVASERRQVELFAGSPALEVEFREVFLRLHPADFSLRMGNPSWRSAPAPSDLFRRAEEIFREEISRSFTVEDPGGSGPLSLIPPPGDLLAEIRTPGHGELTYARVAANPEDIGLLDRSRGRRIATYPSRAHMADRGWEYGDEYGLPYEVRHYDLDVRLDASGTLVAGRALLQVAAVAPLQTVNLRLDGGVRVDEVSSAEQGTHRFFQQAASETLLVRLETELSAGQEIRLEVRYSGTLEPQGLIRETPRSEISRRTRPSRRELPSRAPVLFSNRVYWYPQSPVRNHATATLRITLPPGLEVLASGVSEAGASSLRAAPAGSETLPAEPAGPRPLFFRTQRPVRYLSLLVGDLIAMGVKSGEPDTPLRIMASPRLATRAREAFTESAEIVRFFTSLIGEPAFTPLTLVLVEATAPAAHSPAYLCIFGEPSPWIARGARDDPAYFAADPVFVLAHEIAHQWWGQAVGWRNYREQWLSEAFAQYFAVLYVRQARGEPAFRRALAWMHRWALTATGKGPMSLGIRAGEVTGCAECFPAIVYDRGAYVLHMLRGLLGEESFWKGLKVYYDRWKFRRAGTDDFRRALQEASGRDLAEFFEQWVRGDGSPALEWSAATVLGEGGSRLKVEIEQVGQPFEFPLQLAVEYLDRPTTTQRVRVWLPKHEFWLDLEGRFRQLRVNDDLGTLGTHSPRK